MHRLQSSRKETKLQNNEDKIKQVIVARKDLNMRKGKLAAQVGHAVMYATEDWLTSTKTTEQLDNHTTWQENGTPKVVVGVDSEQVLTNILQECSENGIPAYKVVDEGTTEFGGQQTMTCIAIGPAPSSQIDPMTRLLPLL